MHELSLAHGLIEQILALAAEHKARRVTRVMVTIGPFSGVVRDSFEFGFNILKQEREVLREAVLVLETTDPVYLCLDCGKVSVIPLARFDDRPESVFKNAGPKKCPWCCLPRLSPKGGTELILNQLEMEERHV